MKHFTVNGLWFVGDDSKNRVAGVLRYSRNGLHLKLLGVFRDVWSPAFEPYPLIHGIVSKNPHGEYVTLVDCFTKQTTMSSAGISSEIIHCDWGIAGESFLTPDHDDFEALNIRLSYLYDWFGRKGFSSKFVSNEGFQLDVHYRKPDAACFPIDQSVLKLGMAAEMNQSVRRLTIIEEAHFFIEPLPHLSAKQIQGEYVLPLQNLLSFATDTPNAVEEVELRGEKVIQDKFERNRKYHLLYNPIYRLRRRKTRLLPNNMLFTYEETQEAGLNIFEKWFEITKNHGAFSTVYFAALYAPPRYLDEKFLRIISAFTLLTTTLDDVSQPTMRFLEELDKLSISSFTEKERELIGSIFPTGPEIEMPFRLLKRLEEHQPLMKQIIGDDFSGFVKSVSDTLAFVERRTALNEHLPIQGENLHYVIQKIHVLIKIILLQEIGFKREKISEIIERNNNFVHLKAL